MKTFKIIFAAIIFAGFASSAIAQNQDTGTIKGKAEVLQPMEVTGDVPLEFSFVSPGVNKTVAWNGEVTGNAFGDETAGEFTISAGSGASINFYFSVLPDALSSGANSLLIEDYQAYYNNGSDNDFTEKITSGQTITMPEEDVKIFLGATVKPTPTQAQGEYTADITLTAEYN